MVPRASAALIAGVVSLFSVACTTKQLPHTGEAPAYPLRGNHATVPCAACHGAGEPQALPVVCIACHEDDRPAPDHFVGQGCINCHVEEGWEVVTTTTPKPTVPTGDTNIPQPEFDHSTLPDTQLCWDCHEVDRKDLAHYADPKAVPAPDALKSGDCKGCHTATAWDWEPIVHPVRIPHGVGTGALPGLSCDQVRPNTQWENTCDGCHPNGTDTFTCFACHNEDDTPGDLVHGGDRPEKTCMTAGCHVDAESTGCR